MSEAKSGFVYGLAGSSGVIAGLLVTAAAVYLAKKSKKGKKIPITNNESESKRGPAKVLGFEIEDRCGCGDKVECFDRHQLEFSDEKKVWLRTCATCLNQKKEKTLQ